MLTNANARHRPTKAIGAGLPTSSNSRDTYSYLKEILPNTYQKDRNVANLTSSASQKNISNRSRSGKSRGPQPFITTPQTQLQNAIENYKRVQKSLNELQEIKGF